MNNLFRKFAPRSLYTRFLLIIIIPMVLVQVVAVYMFYERHWSSMSRNMSSSLSGEIAFVLNEFEPVFSTAEQFMNLRIVFKKGEGVDKHAVLPKEYELFAKDLKQRFNYPFTVITINDNSDIEIRILVSGGVLDIVTSKKRLANPTTYIFIMWMTGSAVVLLLVSILFLRNQVRSIVRLTVAAEKFGKGHDMPSFKPQGAKEVRLAAIAFIEMRERIKRLLTRRTQMLAGVSHDLRTPLTRMKLQLALLPEKKNIAKDIDDLQSDIQEMEKMLEGYLEFVRGETTEVTEDINLSQFIKLLLKNYKNYEGKTSYEIKENIIVHIRPNSFKRCLNNLVDNALRYGNEVNITAKQNENTLDILIDDNGSGIEERKRKKVFQPFYRIENSRNIETGGIGLGLSIARDIIHRHGGEITLGENPNGGLRAIITLPI